MRRLLDRYKGDRSAVAAKLGQTARWVALRANVLKGLSKAWVKELGRAASDFRDWTAGHLALIARLDQFRQAEVLRQRTMYGRRDQDVTVRELDQQLNAEYVRELGKARWKLDDAELVPEAGACSECPFRTSKQELLWHDEGEDLDKADRCLNPTCWRSKEVAWAKARFAVEAEKHKATGLVLGVAQDCDYQAACNAHKQFGSEPVRLYSYVAKPCKPNAKGARPVFIAAGKGVGHVRFFAFNSDHRGRQGNKQARGADGKAKPKTLNERRADLEARRAKLVVEWFSASLCGAAAPGLEVVAVLATMFGTEHVYFHAHPPECQWKEYDKRIESGDGIAKELWHSVRGSIRAYLRVYNGAMAVERMPTVKRVGCLVATSVKVLADKAAETVPEPKAWAQLNEDGTPKKAGTKTKKAKKKGRA